MAASAGYFYKEKLLVCPYNWAHVILKSRMQTHLVKCMKSYPESDKVVCPFDATHRVDFVELCEHLENCPSQVNVLAYKYSMGDTGTDQSQFLPVVNRDIQSSENWDDVAVPTYDPGHRLQDPTLLVQLKGATPSERKAFRKQREQMYQAVNKEYNDESFTYKKTEGESADGEAAAGVISEADEAAACATPLPLSPEQPPSARLKNDQEPLNRNPRRARDSDSNNDNPGAAQNREAPAYFRGYSKHFPTPGESSDRPTANTGAIPKSYKQVVENTFESIYDEPANTSFPHDEQYNKTYSTAMDTSSSRNDNNVNIFRKYKGPAFSQKKHESAANNNIAHQKNQYMKNGYLGEVKHYTGHGTNSNYTSHSDDKNGGGDTFDLGTLGNAIPDAYKAPLPPSWGKHFMAKNQNGHQGKIMKGKNLSAAFEGNGWKDDDENNEVGRDYGDAKFAGNPSGCKKKLFPNWNQKYSDEEDNSGMDYAM